jgi:hypothetical protein
MHTSSVSAAAHRTNAIVLSRPTGEPLVALQAHQRFTGCPARGAAWWGTLLGQAGWLGKAAWLGQAGVIWRAARFRALITPRSDARTIDSLIPTPQ